MSWFWGLVSALGIGTNLANDARIHNQKYFGTDREIQRDNERVRANREAAQEIYRKYSKEWQNK